MSAANGVGNILTFGEGIARDDLHAEFDGSDLLVHYGANGDGGARGQPCAEMARGGGRVIDTFEFADGTTVTLREFMNRAPEVAQFHR